MPLYVPLLPFYQPFINPKDQISFEDSFNTCSKSHSNTIAALQLADNRRREIKAAMASGKVIHSSLSQSLKEYIPVINQILLSCKCKLIPIFNSSFYSY